MTKVAEQVLSDAMALDEKERAELAAKLIDTLDPTIDSDYAKQWEAELATRLAELQSGTVKTIAWSDARSMIRNATNGATG